MSASKEQFIERYGGFRFGETQEQLQQRVAQIDSLYAKIASGKATAEDVDEIARLKGKEGED